MKNTNTKNTTKEVKTNKRFIASICAVIAATAMITGIAVFSASASEIKNAPEKPSVTTVAKAEQSTQKSDKSEDKTDVKAESKEEVKAESKAESQPVEQTGKDTVVKHPGEAGYRYYENEKGTQPVEQTGKDTVVKHPGEAGYRYYENEKGTQPVEQTGNNTVVKHPGEAGCCYYENEKGALIPAGRYIAADGSRAALEIAKPDETTCYCTITIGNSYNNDFVYGFMGIANGPEIDYTSGTKNDMTYDDNGNVAKAVEISKGHSGTIERTKSGSFLWIDSDGAHITFIPAE